MVNVLNRLWGEKEREKRTDGKTGRKNESVDLKADSQKTFESG
jgi:hypothetical protein